MRNSYIKTIWLICLSLSSLALVGCFHIPNEDWLPSKGTNIQKNKDNEIEQTLNSLMKWIDLITSKWNNAKNIETNQELDIVNSTNEEYETLEENINQEIES